MEDEQETFWDWIARRYKEEDAKDEERAKNNTSEDQLQDYQKISMKSNINTKILQIKIQ